MTGRSFHFTAPIVDLLPIPLTLIVNNGAVVKRKTGETEMRHVLPRGAARPGAGRNAPPRGQRRHRVRPARRAADRLRAHGLVAPEPPRLLREEQGVHRRGTVAACATMLTEDPIQVMFNGSVEPMRALVAALRAMPIADQFSVAITEYVPRDFSLVDVNGAGCSKGTTLARWVERRGMTPADVMAVGDNLNDVEMLDFAGTAYVMGNATDALKSRGYRLTGTNDEGGPGDRHPQVPATALSCANMLPSVHLAWGHIFGRLCGRR